MSTILGETDLSELTAAKIVDARGAACPGPLLEAKKAMGSVAVGDVLELWSSDSQTKNDVAAWSGKVGHEFLGVAHDRRVRARLHPPDEVTEALVTADEPARATAPRVLVFSTNGISDPGIDLAGSSHMHYSPNVVVISLPCTSGIRPAWILHALQQGFDGVFVASDGDECAYLPDCSERSSRIVAEAQELLTAAGIDGRRLKLAAICSVCAAPFTKHVHDFCAALAGAGGIDEVRRLVVGSGIGGMESALKLGDMGYKVLVVEKEPSVGGKMILLSKVFPTLDCASCISTPKMAATVHHPNVTVFTGSEVGEIVRNGDGSFQRHRPPEAALRRRGALHRLPPVRARVHRGGAGSVQRRARLASRRLHRVPAGGSAEGADRARRHVAVHVRVPRGHQGARLRLARAQRRVREGVRPRARGDAARRQPRTRLLRAVRGASARAAASKGRCRSAA